MRLLLIIILFTAVIVSACQESPESNQQPEKSLDTLAFRTHLIADSVSYLWAHTVADMNGDSITDLVCIENNASGGPLVYYSGKTAMGTWDRVIIAAHDPEGIPFAAGDLECADIDFDGDIDVLAVRHPGEWTDAGAPAFLYWYENPEWKAHRIGQVPDAVKDVGFADLNKDRKMDLVVMTFDENTLSVFEHTTSGEWNRVLFYEKFNNLHEGMGLGDVDGDSWPDIVANGVVCYNPKGKLSDNWQTEIIDEMWVNQEGDWSRNATKVWVQDITGDMKGEVFMSHSERSGYPLVWYDKGMDDKWQTHVIHDSITACHTLQVFDMDLDGDFDVLAGTNGGRAVNLGKKSFPIYIFKSTDNYTSWEAVLLSEEGIYNGQVADYDNDGDLDIFRYPDHESNNYYLLENLLRP